ncbi:MAG: transcriptional repressor [Bacteroidales bacterium]|jgi:Fe2+ or Zn2+ uptake regulation protein|nr:transcriptional repressor [Bacteroidales bacterium]
MRVGRKGIPDIIQFKRMLRDRGLKATPQRSAIHEAMWNLVHAGADDVAAWLGEHGSAHVSPASVYNTLSMLADEGIYSRRSARGGRMVFDARVQPHLHLYDTESEEWRDLEDETMMSWLEAHLKGRRYRGYRIDGFEVQILCHPSRKGPAGKQ